MLDRRTLALTAIVGLMSGAAGSWVGRARDDAATCSGTAKVMARSELLFGGATNDGRAIADADWQAFVDGEVTPHFPAGLTWLRGSGQWRASDGRIVKEPSFVLLVWHDRSQGAEAGLEAVRAAYKKRFAQESVMRVDGHSCVAF